jgi:hypothetical protein
VSTVVEMYIGLSFVSLENGTIKIKIQIVFNGAEYM